MQTSSVTLILVLCLMGGAIAFFADSLGRSLGKKRLTLGHMRPKHTAALITASAGALIPIATIALMSLLFSDVREMLFRTQAIKDELQRVEGRLRVSQKNLDRRAVEVDDLEKAQRTLVREGETLRKTNSETTIKLGSTRSLLSKAQSQLTSRTAQLASLSKRTQSLSGRIRNLMAEVTRNIAQLESLRKEATAAQNSAKTNQAQASYAANRLREIQQRNLAIEQENQALEKEGADLKAQIQTLQKVAADVDEQFRRDLAERNAELAKVMADLEGLQNEKRNLEGILEGLIKQGVNVPRTQPMTIARGQELARWIIEANSSRAQAQLGLSSLMRTARIRAEARGAKPGAGQEAASLFNGDFTPEQQVNNILRDTSSQGEPMVIIASALYNHFGQEPIYYQVSIQPNTVVYQKGQVIAETRVDGSMDDKRVLDAIGRFIRDIVGPKALSDKMLPVVGADAPLGEVNDDQIISLMQQIRDFGRNVRVQAIAAGETRRADRLYLEFRLR